MEKDIKILIVDDTVTERQILSKLVSHLEYVEVIGTAPNGRIALSKIHLNPPDVVLLDVIMPEMDGLETLTHIKKQFPHIDVIMLSALDQTTASLTMTALSAGALDFIPKPRGLNFEHNTAELSAALSRVLSMARTRKYSRRARGIAPFPPSHDPVSVLPAPVPLPPTEPTRPAPIISPRRPPEKPPQKTRCIQAVAIGVSTGGPNALQEIIPKLDADFRVPIFAVQHMPSMFTASLAARLNALSSIRVVEGADGMIVVKGVMYIAPGGRHMVIRKDEANRTVIGLTDSPPVNSCRPSVDVLFRSIAMIYGGNVLTVILTGMGNDGLSGVGAIWRQGGYSIVQDEKTSVIWGMPGAVAAANQADEIVPLDRMAATIMKIVNEGV